MKQIYYVYVAACLAFTLGISPSNLHAADDKGDLRKAALSALHKAATFYRSKVSNHGGYVYHYSPDLKVRWGEGPANMDQIWVQPPGTPTVGMAYLKAFQATGDRFYLDAATDAAEALVYGQLKSGGWTNAVDFNPRGTKVAEYRNGKGRGKNNSTLDDGISQGAIRLLIHVDEAHNFKHRKIHDSAGIALAALLNAQFPNGAFPQVWTGPVSRQPVLKARYPEYDWRTEGRIKNYWDMYTLNDGLAGTVSETLQDAYHIYKQEQFKTSLTRLGDFLILAQLPEPQPAWAQQYNYKMQPIWARRFEPAAVTGGESQDALETLMKLYRFTGNKKYLKPIPRALEYLKKSLLADGQLARYYELKTNKPLYMFRRGKTYTLTYDDSNLPKHYGWKIDSRLKQIEQTYRELKQHGPQPKKNLSIHELEQQARTIIEQLDNQGRWMSTYSGERLIGQAKIALNSQYLSSEVFSRNAEILSAYLKATNK